MTISRQNEITEGKGFRSIVFRTARPAECVEMKSRGLGSQRPHFIHSFTPFNDSI